MGTEASHRKRSERLLHKFARKLACKMWEVNVKRIAMSEFWYVFHVFNIKLYQPRFNYIHDYWCSTVWKIKNDIKLYYLIIISNL